MKQVAIFSTISNKLGHEEKLKIKTCLKCNMENYD